MAIDLPGHGLSSRLPHGIVYSVMNSVNVLNIIQRKFKWPQLSFCSHSMGAQISTLYAAFYPERCDMLICLDGILKPYHGPLEKRLELAKKIGDDFLSLDELNRRGGEPPTYSYDEVVERWSKDAKMTTEAVRYLMKRGTVRSKNDPNRFYFSRDIRLKIMEFGSMTIPEEVHFKALERIAAPHLFIKASNGPKFEGEKRYQQALDILKASNPKFEWIGVAGTHHCHLSHPMLVSEHVSNFISKHRSPTILSPL